MRIHTLLMAVLLLSGLSFAIHAASTSVVPGTGVVGPTSPNTSAAVMTQIQNQIQSMQNLMKQIQALLQALKAEMANKPQKPNTSGMSEEEAAKRQAQYASAIAAWQQRLVGLQNQLETLQQNLAAAEAKLRKLQNSVLPAAQRKDRRAQQRAMQRMKAAERARAQSVAAKTESRNTAAVRTEVRKIQLKSRKQQRDIARILRRARSALQYRPKPRPSSPGGTTKPPSSSGTGLSPE